MLRATRDLRARWTFAFLALASLLAGLFGEGVHGALEEHRWCAVHDALEHGEFEQASHAAEDVAADLEQHEATRETFDRDEPREVHEGCPFDSVLHDETVAWDVADGRSPWFLRDAPRAALPERPAAVLGTRYRLAPKQSPPTA